MANAMFKLLEGETAVILQGGVYKEAEVYTRNNGELYVKASGGFVRIYDNGATSKSGVSLETLHIDQTLYRDQFGKLCIAPGAKRKALEAHPAFLELSSE